MSHNTAWDSLQFNKLDFPYNRMENELSTMPRFVKGAETYITVGGKLCKRPGTINLTNSLKSGYRIDRLWNYETLETPAKIYIVASMYNISMNVWEMWYYRPSATSPAWVQFPNFRSINQSGAAHEGSVFKGLFYVKGSQSSSSIDLLQSIIFDGSGSTSFKPWGILPPTVPAAIAGAITSLVTSIGSGDVSLTVTTNAGFPSVPFNVQIDFELITVTAQTGAGNTVWTITRGVNGTTATAHTAPVPIIWRNWNSSAHQVTVNIGWGYTYAYKSITGQYSNRAPLQTNLDMLPSRTGPFQNLIPKFVIQGIADTTNFPKIGIFRTTDGGGSFFFIEDITNTGAGNITYQDTNFQTGSGGGIFQDPIPDEVLNTGVIAPSLISNSPPPTVITPKVVGVDLPVQSTPIVSYASRQWYAIGNILFYSGNEEISLGIPEECFPSGTNGNFFRYSHPILNLQATSNYLYVFTTKTIEQISGTNLSTFNSRPLFKDIGVPYSNPRAVCSYDEVVAFLTQDYRIGLISNGNITIVSDPTSDDIPYYTKINNWEWDLKHFSDGEKELLFISAQQRAVGVNYFSSQLVYDIKKSEILQQNFFQLPWHIQMSATLSDTIFENYNKRYFVIAHFNGSSTNLAYLDTSLVKQTDAFLGIDTGYTFTATTYLMPVPYGNHVNLRREPTITPVDYAISVDRILYAGDTDPDISYYIDDLFTQPIPFTQYEIPARRQIPTGITNPGLIPNDVSKGYKTIIGPIQKVGQRISVMFSKTSPNNERCELQNLVVTYAPDLGA